jgi:2-oxoisovalerate dehydrogenase E1 component
MGSALKPENVTDDAQPGARVPPFDWPRVLQTVFTSRALDALEESRLVPERKVIYQFCARGHDVTQALLGLELTGRRDGISPYYRSRPLALALGLTAEEALASTMMRREGMSGGRDVGVVINRPNRDGPCLLPSCGGVGTQYTPATGWAQSLVYRARVLKDPAVAGCIALAHGGEASTATNGFWASLNIATTERLPLLYFIEDNGYGISVPSRRQTPGGDIAANLASFGNLRILAGDGSEPLAAAGLIRTAVQAVRAGEGPVLLKLRVPRLSGHSVQDTQAYKTTEEIAAERARDPLLQLRKALVPSVLSEDAWGALEAQAESVVQSALARIEARPPVDGRTATRHVFTERHADGSLDLQVQGGQRADGATPPAGLAEPRPQGARINMLTAIRRTLEHELEINPRVLAFGEDVGRKSTRASSYSARTSAGKAACTRRHSGCSSASARTASSTRACRRRASSAVPSAWRSPASCPCPRSSSASTRSRPRSSCTTAARFAGGPATASLRPWLCACRAGSSSAAIPGTASATRCSSCMRSAGSSRCRPMRRTRLASCARRYAATSP